MSFSFAFLYGLIQGVSEFLPISSSGHLALIPYFFKVKDPGVLFDLMMHLGTALAVIIYFRVEVMRLIREFYFLVWKRDVVQTVFLQNFLVATICSFVLILLIKDYAFLYGRAPLFIGFNFIFFSILMYFSDQKKATDLSLISQNKLKKAALIGLSQSLAVFPGVSRSGITLTTARYMGMSRIEASRFSFLLSIPVILGSILFKLPSILTGEALAGDGMVIISGVFFSFIFGLITIHYFLKLISKIGLVHFCLYRILVGIMLIVFSLSA